MAKQIAVVTLGKIGKSGEAKIAFKDSESAYKWMISNGYEMTSELPYNTGYKQDGNLWARKDNVDFYEE